MRFFRVLFSVITAVQHNMNALNAYNKLNANVAGLKKASEKLSSGYRINRAGDDAAGLAISEKMRSQIRGLNQAVRNSQDGINMIQTFEGAAQESHSILQRMKELASESANGTYDNATDRAAIQLEFDQLNDELNQIADTDFNGTIVLNGGRMSDGLEAVMNDNGTGDFDYANKASQLAAEKADKIKALEEQIADLTANTKRDIGESDFFNTYDNYGYDIEAAQKLWSADDGIGLNPNSDASINVVFEATVDDETGMVTYAAVDGDILDASGKSIGKLTEDQLAKFAPTAPTVADATGYGGFTVSAGGTNNVNVIFDATKVKSGDVITLSFDGPGAAAKAPTNAGLVGYTAEEADAGDTQIDYSNEASRGEDPTVTLAGIKDTDMTEELFKALNALNNAEFTVTATGATAAPQTLGNISVGGTAIAGGGTFTLDGVNFFAELTDGSLKISTAKDGAAGTEILTIDMSKLFAADANTKGGDTATFSIAFDSYNYPTGGGVESLVESSAAYLGEENAANAAKIAELEKEKADLENDVFSGVTKSDAFDNSTARMTYANHIILQTGSRTKDAVDFTFNYNLDDSVDMRGLKNNLNISAREDGLNTENLSLADQDSANEAIDRIDKAINKVSMVRATFGSIQNRLEHKITNLTTTSENLTEAESAIRDTDMASEMMNYTKFNILQQAAQSMLAQANQQPQSILQLLG